MKMHFCIPIPFSGIHDLPHLYIPICKYLEKKISQKSTKSLPLENSCEIFVPTKHTICSLHLLLVSNLYLKKCASKAKTVIHCPIEIAFFKKKIMLSNN